MMAIQLLILIVGLGLIVFGADILVDGASAVARKAGISEFVIGLTIVGFGTSCPELVVSLTGALQGNADISIGNVVGSNICNTLLILGMTALLAPIAITRSNSRRDIPLCLLVTVLFIFCGMNRTILGIGDADMISRVEGIVFLTVFAIYMYTCFKFDSTESNSHKDNAEQQKQISVPVAIILIATGLAGLIFGGRLFVDSAVKIARIIGASDKFIAVTILAAGTSLPELATCIVAAAKHKDQLALGNILGSNIFNILFILGLSATLTPLSMAGMSLPDICTLLLSAILVWLWTYTGKKFRMDRWEGALMVVCYILYIACLIRDI